MSDSIGGQEFFYRSGGAVWPFLLDLASALMLTFLSHAKLLLKRNLHGDASTSIYPARSVPSCNVQLLTQHT